MTRISIGLSLLQFVIIKTSVLKSQGDCKTLLLATNLH